MVKSQVNFKFKDRLFRMIFREKKELLSLYNAMNGTDYENPDELEILTIEDAVYMGMKNDVAFLIEDYLNLYEAQSTLNPNMPLRGLFYFSSLYQGYVAEHHLDIYSGVRLKLPVPKYIVFYNGTEREEERWLERLSDSFICTDDGEMALECTALVLNINYGHNKELMEKCRKLYEYSYFVEEVRKGLRMGKKLSAAVDGATEYCIRAGVLSDFLRRHRAEVKNVILAEYDEELHIKSEKKLSYEEGVLAGEKTGMAAGVLSLLESHGPVPDDLKQRIQNETDTGRLTTWLLLAAKVSDAAEFLKNIE